MSNQNFKRKWSREEENSGDEENVKMIGSFSLNEVKSSADYLRRIEISGAKKRKWALNFGYLGSKYQGLQMNPGSNSVEKYVEKALFLAGGIAETNFADLHKIQWTRTARTDRGVHAVMQCCAMKLLIPLDSRDIFVHNVNSFLPSDIRVNGLTKVTKNFNSKLQCSRRRYHYLLPTYMLQEKSKILEYLNAAFVEQGPITNAGKEGGFAEPGSNRFLGPSGLTSVRNNLKSSRIDNEKIILLRNALKSYEGTKKFHNFTKDKHPSDSNATRYITSFTCGEPFVDAVTDSEWVLLSIDGQSFLLNQIRKMIGLACEVVTGKTNLEMMKVALSDKKVEIPMAPGLGLYLDELFWDNYNTKQTKAIKESPPVTVIKQLIPSITATSIPTNSVAIDPVLSVDAATATVPSHSIEESNASDNITKTVELPIKEEVLSFEKEKQLPIKEEGFSIKEEGSLIKEEDSSIKEEGSSIKEEGSSIKEEGSSIKEEGSSIMEEGSSIKEEGSSIMEESSLIKEGIDSTELNVDADEDGGSEPNLGEIIDWSVDPVVSGNMTALREGVIWPHIFQEDQKNLHFLYYMDYLRVFSYNFQVKDYPEKKSGNKNEKKNSGNDRNWKNKMAKKEKDSGKTIIKAPGEK